MIGKLISTLFVTLAWEMVKPYKPKKRRRETDEEIDRRISQMTYWEKREIIKRIEARDREELLRLKKQMGR